MLRFLLEKLRIRYEGKWFFDRGWGWRRWTRCSTYSGTGFIDVSGTEYDYRQRLHAELDKTPPVWIEQNAAADESGIRIGTNYFVDSHSEAGSWGPALPLSDELDRPAGLYQPMPPPSQSGEAYWADETEPLRAPQTPGLYRLVADEGGRRFVPQDEAQAEYEASWREAYDDVVAQNGPTYSEQTYRDMAVEDGDISRWDDEGGNGHNRG